MSGAREALMDAANEAAWMLFSDGVFDKEIEKRILSGDFDAEVEARARNVGWIDEESSDWRG